MILKNLSRRFAADTGGNYAMIFALVAMPLFAGIGLTVDYVSMSQRSSTLQAATDSAVLFASRYYEVNGKLPNNEEVKVFIEANYAGVVDTYDVKIVGENIVVSAEVNNGSYVMGMFRDDLKGVKAQSGAPVSKDNVLEVVMALDTTYSMIADDKIGGLKIAATDFTELLMGFNKNQTSVKIGVVPFSQYVNVGLHNRAEPWLSVPADSVKTLPAQCFDRQDVVSTSNCHDATGYADGVPYTYQQCDYTYGPVYQVCEPERQVETKWYGCVGSREAPLTLTDNKPKMPFPGMMADWDMTGWECPTAIQPLTNDKAAVLAAISGLQARGETYIVEGVTWGQRVLSPAAPFTDGVDPKKAKGDVHKVMVLMSDGDNKASSQLPDYYGHWGTDAAQSDAWTLDACKLARKAGTEIFTITFGKEVSTPAKKVMKKCATNDDHYFDASSSAELAKAFEKIAGNLTRVRLTM